MNTTPENKSAEKSDASTGKPFDPKGVKLLATHAAPGALFSLCFDETTKQLYGAGTDGALYSVDVAASLAPTTEPAKANEKLADKPTDKPPAKAEQKSATEKQPAIKRFALHDNYVSSLALAQGQLISGGFDRRLIWTDLATGKTIRSTEAHAGWVRKLVRTPDGTRTLSVGDDMLLKIWDNADGKLIASLSGHNPLTPEGYLSALYSVAISPDGKFAATIDRAAFARVWDLAAGKTIAEFRPTELYTFDPVKRARAIGGPRSLAFSADGSRIAISGIGPVTNVDGFVGPCRIELWDWRAGKQLGFVQEKHQAILNHVAFGPAADWLIGVGGGDSGGAIVFWNSNPFPTAPAANDSKANAPQSGASQAEASNTGTAKATASKTEASPPVISHVAKPKGHLHSFALNAAGTQLYAAGHAGFQIWQLPAT